MLSPSHILFLIDPILAGGDTLLHSRHCGGLISSLQFALLALI